MPKNLIKTLIESMPRYAEEEGDFYSVHRNSLINALCQRHSVEDDIAENTVLLCEYLLDSLSVLQAD